MLLSGGSIYTPTVVNHSDLLNSGTNTHDQIDAFISSKSQNSGLAPLDGTGKIPLTHLPTSSQTFKGLWNAQTNTPPLLDNGIGGVLGDYYIVNVGGNTLVDGINTWDIGDWVVHTGSKWERIDQPDPELVDVGTEYKTVKNKPIFNNAVPSDPSHLVQKLYADGIQTNLQNQINTKINLTEKATANGVATLDASTKIPISQIPQIDHATLSNIGNRNHSIIDIDLDDHTLRLDNIEPKIQNIISGDSLSTQFNDKKIKTTISLANIVDNDQLVTKEFVDANINNHINDLTIHRVINDGGTTDDVLFSAQKILALDSAQEAKISTNTLNISNLQTEQTTQNQRLDVIELEQTTQNNNILTNTNNITSNDNDILILQQQQGVQDNAISTNASNIATNSANIGVMQSKTTKLNINGNPDSILSYNVAVVPSLASDLVNKAYVDGLTSSIQSALRYCGTYDALNNIPDLISGGPYQDGCYHIVNVEGTRDLGQGPILFGVSDWVVRQAGAWARIEYSSQELIDLQNQITANLNAIQSNDLDITNLQGQITGNLNSINTLNSKTQKLSTSGDIQASILPTIDANYDLGNNLIRFKDGYFSNILRTDTTLNSNNLLNTSNNIGISISNDINGQVSFNSTSLYANGNINRVPVIGASGEISKSGVIITNQNIECKNITCQKIIGNTGGPNDLVLNNQAGNGLIIKDGATANICLDGDAYTTNAGKYLKIEDSKGLIVASTPPGGGDVVGSTTSLLNQIPRYTDTSGKIIKNSLATISDVGVLSVPFLDGGNIYFGIVTKADITPELNTDILNLGAANLPFARIYLNSANSGGIYIDGVLQTLSGAINGITSTENPASSGQYDIIFNSTQYQQAGTLKIDATGKIYVVPDIVNPLITPTNLISNTSDPNFLLDRSSVNGAPDEAYKMFDNNQNTVWYPQQNTYNSVTGLPTNLDTHPLGDGAWFSITLNEPKIFNQYSLMPFFVGSNPTSWIIYGRNQITDPWTSIEAVNDYTWPTFTDNGNPPTIVFNLTGDFTYRYILFRVTKILIGGGTTSGFREVRFIKV